MVPASPARKRAAAPRTDAGSGGASGGLQGFDGEVGSLLCLTEAGLPMAIEALGRYDCTIGLVALNRDGSFGGAAEDWTARAREALVAAGVPPSGIRVIERAEDLRPADLILNLEGFGDAWKVRHLAPVIERGLHADSRMISDIRKGSGGYPFLKGLGSVETLSARGEGNVARVLFRPDPPPEAPVSDPGWAEIARGLAGPEGFYHDNGMHSFLFIPRGETLVVTFDNLDIAMNKREERRPWGYSFIEKQGWSMLGVMANGWTWYRDPWVFEQFDRLATEGFFRRFARVVFYGASMGGYAACAFAPAHPGADVVAISPQSTLDKALVPWETRYKTAWGRDFSGKYGDAAQASRAAGRVALIFDPYEPLDAGHADRFEGDNVMKLRAPLLGHRLGSSLQQMGILNPIILAALDGSLRESDFYRALRARHLFPRYQRELFQRALDRGRPGLARRVGTWVLKRGDNRVIRLGMQSL